MIVICALILIYLVFVSIYDISKSYLSQEKVDRNIHIRIGVAAGMGICLLLKLLNIS